MMEFDFLPDLVVVPTAKQGDHDDNDQNSPVDTLWESIFENDHEEQESVATPTLNEDDDDKEATTAMNIVSPGNNNDKTDPKDTTTTEGPSTTDGTLLEAKQAMENLGNKVVQTTPSSNRKRPRSTKKNNDHQEKENNDNDIDIDTKESMADLQKRLRRESNRESARKSRLLKKQRMEHMEQQVAKLQNENERLKAYIVEQFGSNAVEQALIMLDMDDEKNDDPQEEDAPDAKSSKGVTPSIST